VSLGAAAAIGLKSALRHEETPDRIFGTEFCEAEFFGTECVLSTTCRGAYRENREVTPKLCRSTCACRKL
jgi:hypothetical protein